MQEKELGETIINNAIIVNYGALQGIYDENGKSILGQTPHYKIKDKIEFIDEKVVFLGFFRAHHGHFITEELARLWWVLQNGTKDHKFIYSRFQSKDFSVFERFILNLFGLNEQNLIPITKPTQFRQIILPDDSFYTNDIETHRKMIDFITSKVKPIENEALYLSRRKFDKARSLEFGEEYFEEIYAQKGYKIIYPETLSPKEQLALWGGAHKFATVGGTLPHNMIFAPYGSELEIILKTSFPNHFQAIVERVKKLQTKRIHAYIELYGVNSGRGPFLFLPRNLTMSKENIQSTANNIRQYLIEYKKDLAANRLWEKPNQTQLNESFIKFKDDIKQVNDELFAALSSEFNAFERFTKLYFLSPKLAWWFFRIRYFPNIINKEFHRTLKKVFK